jgi:hypothetical protein
MSEPAADYYGLAVAAALDGENIALQVARDAAAITVMVDAGAAPLARVLAGAAVGALRADEAELLIRHDAGLRQAVVDLSDAQAGDVRIDQVAGRDIVTINVYVGSQGGS